MNEKEPKITCPIFRKQEPAIKAVTGNINRASGVKEKARWAEELKKETDVLLSCQDYDENSSDCKNCRFIANVRKKTAELIIKTKKLV